MSVAVKQWFAIWHPELGWGPMGVPVLMTNKRYAAKSTGISLKKMHELGWRWRIFAMRGSEGMFAQLEQTCEDWEASGIPALVVAAGQVRKIINEDGTSGNDGTADREVDAAGEGDAD